MKEPPSHNTVVVCVCTCAILQRRQRRGSVPCAVAIADWSVISQPHRGVWGAVSLLRSSLTSPSLFSWALNSGVLGERGEAGCTWCLVTCKQTSSIFHGRLSCVGVIALQAFSPACWIRVFPSAIQRNKPVWKESVINQWRSKRRHGILLRPMYVPVLIGTYWITPLLFRSMYCGLLWFVWWL